MTLIALDGFDNFGTDAIFLEKWTPERAQATTFDTGRSGIGQSVIMSGQRGFGIPIPNTQTIFVGAAFNWSVMTGGRSGIVFEFLDITSKQLRVALNGDTGQLYVNDNGNNNILGVSVQNIKKDNWYYIEVKATAKNALGAGDVEVRVNGETWITVSSGDTAISNEYINFVRIGGFFSGTGTYFTALVDDFYFTDTIGSAPQNTFLGDLRVDTLRPDGNGTTSDFVGSDANSVDNYLLVDETPSHDGDTTYVESATVNEIDLYTIESMPSTPLTILGVQSCVIAKKDDAGVRTGNQIVRTGATNYEGDEFFPSNASYSRFESRWEVNPNTAIAWIESDITSLEIGIKVES